MNPLVLAQVLACSIGGQIILPRAAQDAMMRHFPDLQHFPLTENQQPIIVDPRYKVVAGESNISH